MSHDGFKNPRWAVHFNWCHFKQFTRLLSLAPSELAQIPPLMLEEQFNRKVQ